MKAVFKTKTRSLLRAMVATDFKIRYQGSVLGYLWSFVRPLTLFVVLYIVFAKFFKVGANVPYFGVYLLLGIMLWNFIAEATSSGLSSLVERGDLIRKVQIPRYIIVITAVSSAGINLVINLLVVAIIAFIVGVPFNPEALAAVPLLLVELVIMAMAFSFLLSVLYVRFRDIKYIWELFLQVAFYATPIIYPISKIPEKYQSWIALSPATQIIQDMRYVLVTTKTKTSWEILGFWKGLIPVASVLILSIISYWYFKKHIGSIAEEI